MDLLRTPGVTIAPASKEVSKPAPASKEDSEGDELAGTESGEDGQAPKKKAKTQAGPSTRATDKKQRKLNMAKDIARKINPLLKTCRYKPGDTFKVKVRVEEEKRRLLIQVCLDKNSYTPLSTKMPKDDNNKQSTYVILSRVSMLVCDLDVFIVQIQEPACFVQRRRVVVRQALAVKRPFND